MGRCLCRIKQTNTKNKTLKFINVQRVFHVQANFSLHQMNLRSLSTLQWVISAENRALGGERCFGILRYAHIQPA